MILLSSRHCNFHGFNFRIIEADTNSKDGCGKGRKSVTRKSSKRLRCNNSSSYFVIATDFSSELCKLVDLKATVLTELEVQQRVQQAGTRFLSRFPSGWTIVYYFTVSACVRHAGYTAYRRYKRSCRCVIDGFRKSCQGAVAFLECWSCFNACNYVHTIHGKWVLESLNYIH